ncbi:MAG: metallophosphoesterase family protein [Candidatus Aenigmarchaeota archaeon]|nr:metallophosphoesterase family protein [Candidatus Aenigmarchaeota archaeon]
MAEKKEIIKKFFERGYLLTPESVDFLVKSKNYENLLNKIGYINKFILSIEDFSKFEKSENRIKIIKNLTKRPEELTTETFTKFYNSKFEKMRKIILERIKKEFISIDKIDDSRQKVHVIGIVREIKENKEKTILEIEDPTRSINIVFDNLKDKIEIDDVIAVSGIGSRNMIFGKEIIYPDIPLRQPTKGFGGKICAISDLRLEEAPIEKLIAFLKWFNKLDIKYLIVVGDIGDLEKFNKLINEYILEKTIFLIPGEKDKKEYPSLPLKIKNDNIVSLSNPSIIEINNIKFLLIHKFNIEMLKKRYLGKSKLILEDDYLVLEDIPDVVICGHTQEPNIFNYKAITIINSGSLLTNFKPTILDLATREYEQMTF